MEKKDAKMPVIIDLFAGAGGLSLGAFRVGFNVACAVELDERAIETHKKNFPETKHLQLDLESTDSDRILELAFLKKEEIVGIIGGPPCQGFSVIGHGQIDDTRNNLFVRFFQLVSEIHPAFFVAENVLGIMNDRYKPIRQNAFSRVNGYTLLPPMTIKASEYGAPTTRTRVFFVGYDPIKVHAISEQDFVSVKCPADQMIHVKNALLGLPLDVSNLTNANALVSKDYFDSEEIQASPFHKRVQNCIPDGVGDKTTIENYTSMHVVTGCIPTNHSDKVRNRYATLEAGKQDKISKSIKLDPNGFCPTIRAGTGPERGSYQAVRPIHYAAPRVITLREAARLQGFPDWFIFHDTIWHSFRQIGNSVSPIVAEKILSVIFHKLT